MRLWRVRGRRAGLACQRGDGGSAQHATCVARAVVPTLQHTLCVELHVCRVAGGGIQPPRVESFPFVCCRPPHATRAQNCAYNKTVVWTPEMAQCAAVPQSVVARGARKPLGQWRAARASRG
eukprot:2256626-Prymnesium_polylepis.1